MFIKKIILLMLLLAVTLSLSFLIGSIYDENIFDINEFGFQFLTFSVLGSFVYFSFINLKKYDLVLIVIFISATYVLLLNKTLFVNEMGGLKYFIIYSLLLFSVFTVIFSFTWFRFKYVRNILFSILEATGYVLVHLILHLLIKRPIKSQYILIYFLNGLKIMITLGVSFSIVEFIYSKLEELFFKPPQRVIYSAEDDNESDQ